MDTDLFFFSDAGELFAEKPDASLFLTDHRNSERFASYYKLTGQYNTGFVGARNTGEAYRAVWQWRQDCISYCTVEMNEEKKTYGDQRYVEKWPAQFEHVHVTESIGANAALWNIEQYDVSLRDGAVYVNDTPPSDTSRIAAPPRRMGADIYCDCDVFIRIQLCRRQLLLW